MANVVASDPTTATIFIYMVSSAALAALPVHPRIGAALLAGAARVKLCTCGLLASWLAPSEQPSRTMDILSDGEDEPTTSSAPPPVVDLTDEDS